MSVQIHVLVLLQWTDELVRVLPNEVGVVLGEHDTIHGAFAALVNTSGTFDLEYLETRIRQYATIQPYDTPLGLYAIVRNFHGGEEEVKKNALLRLVHLYEHVLPELMPKTAVLILVLENNIRNAGRYTDQPELSPVETHVYTEGKLESISNAIISDVTENASINTISNFPRYLVDNDAAGDIESTQKLLKKQIDNLAYSVFLLRNNVHKLLVFYERNDATNNLANNNQINRLTVHLANKLRAFQDLQSRHKNQPNMTQVQLLQLNLLTEQMHALRMLKSRIKSIMAQEVVNRTR